MKRRASSYKRFLFWMEQEKAPKPRGRFWHFTQNFKLFMKLYGFSKPVHLSVR
ncbi:hypothetical protein Hanom_Chr01g00081561 [Helianthus anomalus]